METTAHITFEKGTLVLSGFADGVPGTLPHVQWDERVSVWRAPAQAYREIVLRLRKLKIRFRDEARTFEPTAFPLASPIEPRSYQAEAVEAWKKAGYEGTIVLPTGAGKTIVAVLLIKETSRPTLIHVPTIDLMHQWYEVLKKSFGCEIGLLGGGYHEIQPITVSTYDSALIHVTYKGNQFGFIIFDECHHLPSEQYQYVARASIAPFRLGLTATPERSDGREHLLYALTGDICYRAHIDELEGNTLAPYEVKTVEIELSEDERIRYETARTKYTEFLRSEHISMGSPNGWKLFLIRSSQSPHGREAFKAYLEQKKLSQAATGKEAEIWGILQRHSGERTIIFTQDNDMAYRIGKRFLLPVLTHKTKVKERNEFLEAFRSGTYSILVTSKVLNEGVDVPEASVAIIVSGSGSIREHVQRLGRILRKKGDKQALLYELVTKQTGEHFVNQRRRQHRAFGEESR